MSLDVYLHGERVGTLSRVRQGEEYEFAYSENALARYGRGTGLLSTSLPTAEEPFSPAASRAYVEGLLPEGMRRLRLARELGVDPKDGYALIAALGGDCIGGASFLPPGTAPPCPGASQEAWVAEEELEDLVAAPPSRLLDPDRPPRMRAALPGIRHKLALARAWPGARWSWPTADRPSTHIVKPETGEHPEMVANELFCTAAATEAGLLAAPVALETIGGRPCIVSERFDRSVEKREVTRLHQESFCQALSFTPDAVPGSDEAEGPSFAEAAGLLRAVGEERQIPSLLGMALCNYIVGNGDCHGANFALMVFPSGALLAPFHDIVSSAVYDDPTHRGMVVASDYDETAYLLELAEICEEARLDLDDCRRVAASVSARMNRALRTVAERARQEGWYAPVIDGILELASERAVNLGYEVQY